MPLAADREIEKTIERRQYLFGKGQLSRVRRRVFDRLRVAAVFEFMPKGCLVHKKPIIAALLLAITT
jgi:hypothetical protein